MLDSRIIYSHTKTMLATNLLKKVESFGSRQKSWQVMKRGCVTRCMRKILSHIYYAFGKIYFFMFRTLEFYTNNKKTIGIFLTKMYQFLIQLLKLNSKFILAHQSLWLKTDIIFAPEKFKTAIYLYSETKIPHEICWFISVKIKTLRKYNPSCLSCKTERDNWNT